MDGGQLTVVACLTLRPTTQGSVAEVVFHIDALAMVEMVDKVDGVLQTECG
jgi:hypothetical protein